MNDSEKVTMVREIVCRDEEPTGNRRIVVLDRGWIFVGDYERKDNMCRVSNAKNVRHWKQGGFGGLTQSAKSAGAILDDCAPIEFDASAMILSVPIGGGWDA